MKHQAFKKARLALSLTAIALSIGALAGTGSAAAATQHWGTAPEVPFGSSQSFTGKGTGNVQLQFTFSGIEVSVACTSLSGSGTAENPAGGGAGTLTGTSLSLGGCITNLPNCVFKGESLSFETQKGTLLEESDKAKVRLEPASGTTMLVATFEPGCSLGSSWVFTGILEATQNSSKLGYYAFLPTGLKFGKQSVEIKGEFTLSTPPNHALSAIAGALGGGPRWHLSPEEWTTIPTGVSTSFINEAPFLFSFSTTIGGSPVNVTCGEYGNYVAGTVENPAGGSAGTASGLFTFQACETNVKTCIIESAGSPGYLEGVAMEASGAPAVQWSPSSGTALLVFNMKPGCFAGSVIALTGKLITTSEGDGRFSLANSELRVGKQKATASSEFTLETGASGEYLRLQP